MHIECVREKEALAGLAGAWSELLVRSGQGNIFLSWEWLSTWWEIFGGGKDCLFVLVAKEGEGVVGIAPLYLRRSGLFREVRFLGDGLACSDHMGFIAEPDRRDAVTRLFLDHLMKEAVRWDSLVLEGIPADGTWRSALDEWAGENDLVFRERDATRCFFINLPDSFDLFLSGLGHSFVKELRYKSRRLEKSHELRYVAYRGTDAEERFPVLVGLHQKRWKGKGYRGVGVFCSERFLEFHRRIARIFSERGWLEISFLRVDGNDVAAHYNFSFGRTIFHYMPAFDPAWAAHNVGRIILAESIRDAIARKMKEFDFLRGDEAYKLQWTALARREVRLLVRRNTPSMNIVFGLSACAGALKGAFTSFVPEALKRAIRRGRM